MINFLRYVSSRVEQEKREETYRFYITDALQTISENCAKFVGGNYIPTKYRDIIAPKPIETRTAKEVIDNLREKLRKGR